MSVTAGAMQSTTVRGNTTLSFSQDSKSGRLYSIKAVTASRNRVPFACRLSQLMTVSGRRCCVARAARPCAIQPIAEIGSGGNAEYPPVAAVAAQRVFGEHGLMHAMKRAQSQMHDAHTDVLEIIVRTPHIGRQPRKRLSVESGHHNRYADFARPYARSTATSPASSSSRR